MRDILAMVSLSCTTTIRGDWRFMPVGANVPASSTAFSSSSVICSGLYFRMLRLFFNASSTELVMAFSTLSVYDVYLYALHNVKGFGVHIRIV